MPLEQWDQGFSNLRYVMDNTKGSTCDKAVALAIHFGAMVRDDSTLQASLCSWGASLERMNESQMDVLLRSSCGDIIERLPDFPMILGLAWLACQTGGARDFRQFRSFVHNLRVWQIRNKIGVPAEAALPAKVHQLIEMHADFVPNATSLCVFHARPEELKVFCNDLLDALRPSLMCPDGSYDYSRVQQLLNHGLVEDLQTCSKETANTMIQMTRMVEDYIHGVGGDLVASSRQRLRNLPPSQELFDVRAPSEDEAWLRLRLLFVAHTAEERARLLDSLDEASSEAFDLALSCIHMPTRVGLELLPDLFHKISYQQMLRCAHDMNAIPCERLVACIDDKYEVVDASLKRVFDAAYKRLLVEIDSETISVLNATVGPQAPARWLDVLATFLERDEQRAFDAHGDAATVVVDADATALRLLFLADVIKLLETVCSARAFLVVNFYTSEQVPCTLAREVVLDAGDSIHERRARFAHKCFEELRMHRRPKLEPFKLGKDGVPIDYETMPAHEIIMRKEANAIVQQYITPMDIVDEELEAPPEKLEFVQHDPYKTKALPQFDSIPLDQTSFNCLKEVRVLRRQRGCIESWWPYKTATGCQMALVPDPTSMTPSRTTPPIPPELLKLLFGE